MLLFTFAFAVMADPVSPLAYAIEPAVRALRGNPELLLPTMALILVIVVLVVVNDHRARRYRAGSVGRAKVIQSCMPPR